MGTAVYILDIIAEFMRITYFRQKCVIEYVLGFCRSGTACADYKLLRQTASTLRVSEKKEEERAVSRRYWLKMSIWKIPD